MNVLSGYYDTVGLGLCRVVRPSVTFKYLPVYAAYL